MPSVDDRIVAMQFDNKSFEQRVASTIASLGRLKSSLDFSSANRGLNDLTTAGRNFQLDGIATAIEGISSKFTAFGAVAFTVLQNVVNRAVDAGFQLGKSLSLDQVLTGFREYETNINSIQTILANTQADGTNLQQVNDALDQLNEYSDKTIYNFSEMARNIGTFTAAGVDLETSVGSIKGIANLAAISGSNSQQAATAMYQLSQAIASGSVKLMDWNSVVNAGMGGEVFQRALFETGKALGTITDVDIDTTFEEWKDAGNSFRSSLSETQEAAGSASDELTRVTEENTEAIVDAEESAAEAISNAQRRIADAQENVADTAQRASEDMAAAVENQQEVQRRAAESVERAFQDVIAARDRLQKALEPASEDDLEAATDRLTTAQLDQADLANAITDAQRDQSRAADDLSDAQRELFRLQNDPSASFEDIDRAYRRVEDAERRVADLADAVERARIAQNAAARDLTKAEEELAEVKKKGTEADQNVIDSRKDLSDAETAYAEAKTQAEKAVQDAADRVSEVAEVSSERQQMALEQLDEAQRNSAKVAERAQESIAAAHENAAKRIEALSQSDSPLPGWLTSDVLTTTLQAFTGDLDEAQLIALGYSAEQAKEFVELGKTGADAASKVKTLSQLIQTVKESIASGWAQSFRIIFGDFEEAKSVFSSASDVLGGLISSSADARNELLTQWSDLGGRDSLIAGVTAGFEALKKVLDTIGSAFKEVFPPLTAERLKELTDQFRDFMEGLKFSDTVLDRIKRAFRGVFSALSIGWEIVKGAAGVFADLFTQFSGFSDENGGVLEFFANIGDKLFELKKALVDGGAIKAFFEDLPGSFSRLASTVVGVFTAIKDAIFGLFSGGDAASGLSTIVEGVGTKLEGLGEIGERLKKVWERVVSVFRFVKNVLTTIGDFFKDAFFGISSLLGEAFANTDYSQVLDAINTGLFAGLVVLLRQFLKDGGLLGGDFLRNVSRSFEELTGVLSAMQVQLKAEALFKIAAAMALLTGSILVLSLIDSAALTKSMTALAVGFGQLVTAMALLSQISGGVTGAASTAILAGGLILLAGAILILSFAAKNLSGLNWEEIGKGLTAVVGLLGAIAGAAQLLQGNTAGLIRAGIGMIAIAIALNIMASAVKSFAEMNWGDLAKGMAGVAAALVAVTAAMAAMPAGMVAKGIGFAAVAVGLNILALAVRNFGSMDMEQLLQGLIGIGAALLLITVAMGLMPPNLALQGAGLLAIGIGLYAMSKAIGSLGKLSWGQMIKGLVGIAAVLVVLGVATAAMSGSIGGSIALGIAAVALGALSKVLKTFAGLKWGDLIKGLVGIAAVLVVLGVGASLLTPVIPAMLGLGAALLILGAGFALFGVGAGLVAGAFKTLAEAGTGSVAVLIEVVRGLISLLPELITAFADGLILLAQKILDAAPELVANLSETLHAFFDMLIENIPVMVETLQTLVLEGLKALREIFPELVTTGLDLLLELLKGIRDNIVEVTNTGVDIVLKFLEAVTSRMQDIVNKGIEMLVAFLNAIADNIQWVIDAGGNIIINFITGMGNLYADIVTAGTNALISFLNGVVAAIPKIAAKITEVVTAITTAIGNEVPKIVDAGLKMFIALFDGIAQAVRDNSGELGRAMGNMISALVEGLRDGLIAAIKEIANDLFPGLGTIVSGILDFFGIASPSKLFYWIGTQLMYGLDNGINDNNDQIVGSVLDTSDRVFNAMSETMQKLPGMFDAIEDINPTITPVLDLTNVQKGANQIGSLLGGSTIVADLSLAQASALSAANRQNESESQVPVVPEVREVRFEQNIYSPTELSAAEIYRQTRTQITLAKEELQVA